MTATKNSLHDPIAVIGDRIPSNQSVRHCRDCGNQMLVSKCFTENLRFKGQRPPYVCSECLERTGELIRVDGKLKWSGLNARERAAAIVARSVS